MKQLRHTYISNPEYMILTDIKPSYVRGSRAVILYPFQLRLAPTGLSILPVLPLASMGTSAVLISSKEQVSLERLREVEI